MPKIFYPFDAQAFWMRTGMVSMLGGLGIVIGLMVLLANLDVPHKILAVVTLPPMFLILVWEVTLPLFVRQRVEDGLRIDGNGLARVLSGREESWRWDEVSDFRLHSRWHPMGLIIGRSITFRGFRPARRSRLAGLFNRVVFGGRNMALGDNYLVVSEELVDRLNRYRDVVTGAAPKPATDESVRAPEPALFTARESLNPRKRSKAALILLGMTLLGVAVTAGIIMWVDNWLPRSVEEFVNSDRVFAMLLPVFLIFAQSLSQHFWQSSPAANLILAAAGGLHSRKGLQRRLWRWDEVADISVKAAPPAANDRSSGQTVSFTAIHDGTRPGKPAADGPAFTLLTAFDDIYDTPVGEIERQLETWARWGRTHAGPVTQDAVTETATAVRPTSSAMRYQRQAARHSGVFRTPAMLIFWMVPLANLALVLLLLPAIRVGAYGPVLSLAMLGLMLLSMVGSFGLLFLAVGGGFNYLEVDPSGLVYRRLGWRKTYGWHELAGFELRSAALRWRGTKRSVILFTAPRDDRISRYMRWAYGIDGALPRIVIEDVYDIAVSELFATFQQYGRRGGRVSRRLSA